ncbi:MAG TPA: hypothetical protein VEC57_15995 [Candidatus Limnocylindrales bacterium]|nr:hypothetical protein [Candidatus Limnocylindrales bacterium]
MTARRVLLLVICAVTVVACLRHQLMERRIDDDNRLYFYLAERAASGVAPHVSAPDVKTQLGTLTFAASIAAGRMLGADDVIAGRLGSTVTLALAAVAVAALVLEITGSALAAALAVLALLTANGVLYHTAVGFNPKIPLMAALAWAHLFFLRGRFGLAGAAAAAAVLCWQIAALVYVTMAVACLRWSAPMAAARSFAVGSAVVVMAYEAYFAWHGALAAQLFQTVVLPMGGAGHKTELAGSFWFIVFGPGAPPTLRGLPVLTLAWLLADRVVARWRRQDVWAAERSTALTINALAAAAAVSLAFTVYERQGAPDRFLLVPYFAIAAGLATARVLHALGGMVGSTYAAVRAELVVAIAALLLLTRMTGTVHGRKNQITLADQRQAASVISIMNEMGSVWVLGAAHLLGLAHVTNYHPLSYFGDDLGRYIDKKAFTPVIDGRLPDVIVRGQSLPGPPSFQRQYAAAAIPALERHGLRVFVRRDAPRVADFALAK